MLVDALSGQASRLRAATAVFFTFIFAATVWSAAAEAKTPGNTYCYNGICHRVKTLGEMQGMVGATESLTTSFYDDCKRDRFNPCGLTSSGAHFEPWKADNAASPIYPNGTILMLFNPATKAAAVVRVNNAGPYWGNRKLDVSRAAAEKLGFKSRGIAKLQVKVLKAPSKAEAKYAKGRTYAPVQGFVGKFASLDAAVVNITGAAAVKVAEAAPRQSKKLKIALMTPIAGKAQSKPTRLASR